MRVPLAAPALWLAASGCCGLTAAAACAQVHLRHRWHRPRPRAALVPRARPGARVGGQRAGQHPLRALPPRALLRLDRPQAHGRRRGARGQGGGARAFPAHLPLQPVLGGPRARHEGPQHLRQGRLPHAHLGRLQLPQPRAPRAPPRASPRGARATARHAAAPLAGRAWREEGGQRGLQPRAERAAGAQAARHRAPAVRGRVAPLWRGPPPGLPAPLPHAAGALHDGEVVPLLAAAVRTHPSRPGTRARRAARRGG